MNPNDLNAQKYICKNRDCEQYLKSESPNPIYCTACGKMLTAIEEIK